ncbi:MAG: 50S ribosomal protein L15 [Deltaproteobacteria bacterium]|nr:50S ribosomal protein L15 [Deltaproteobacteria bacterium]
MNLSNLERPVTAGKRKRVGRGESSGLGKTCGKGHKGQKSRSGGKVARGFEGGQMPLQRRLPKKGFNNVFRTEYNVVSLETISKLSPSEPITGALLREMNIVKRVGPIKLLSDGEVSAAYIIRLDAISDNARKKIGAAGGRVE